MTSQPPPVDDRARTPFHSGSLTVWLLAALLPSLLTSHPVYLGIALALISWTHRTVSRSSAAAAAWSSFARVAIFFVAFTLLFNLLLGTAGETVLLELPAWKVTDDEGLTIFQIGGPVTVESLAAGLIRAVALLSVILALATFNSLVDHAQLLRGLPRWLDQAGTVVTIAIAFMPQLVAAQKEIREALALRGHRIRSLRDFLPLLLTLLTEALDRAMGLAESMEARGYSGPPLASGTSRRSRWLIAAGLLAIGGGAVLGGLGAGGAGPAAAPDARSSWPWLAMAAGAVLIVAALRAIGRRNRRTRFRREPWRGRDTALVAVSGGAGLCLTGLFLRSPELFAFEIFPKLTSPELHWVVPLLLIGTLAPIGLLRLSPAGPRPSSWDRGDR